MKNKSYSYFCPFDQGDPAGILFFGNYFSYAHRSIEKFIVDCGISWNFWFNHNEWVVPLVHVEADYKAPISAGEEFSVTLSKCEIGESSVQFSCEFTTGNKKCAQLKTVHVFTDRDSQKKIPVPDNIRQALES